MRSGKDTPTGPATDKVGEAKVQGRAKVQGKDRDMGSALRSVYQRTVDETIPEEMLSLLGKLD